jgi:hypothetical protein
MESSISIFRYQLRQSRLKTDDRPAKRVMIVAPDEAQARLKLLVAHPWARVISVEQLPLSASGRHDLLQGKRQA